MHLLQKDKYNYKSEQPLSILIMSSNMQCMLRATTCIWRQVQNSKILL